VPVTFRCRTAADAAKLPTGPLVRKPIDGAGSWHVCLTHRAELAAWLDGSQDICVQAFCPGRPASVVGLCGGRQPELLPPCWQWLEPPTFAYRGGEVIVAGELAERARRLASRALAALPATRGYVGVDLVLGEPPDGSRDVVIEVNPRLTTSYVGLRQLATSNLAEAMWRLATGTTANVSCPPRPLQFDTAGRVGSTTVMARR
jgi:predicted ATP-grasp superfamily ATP-dependent carboligase